MVEGLEAIREGYEDANNEVLKEVEFTEGNERERLICIVQRILLSPSEEKQSQRHVLFRTRCTINKKVCEVMVGSGSSENLVSKKFVKVIGLVTQKHPKPLSWVDKERSKNHGY